MVLVANPSDRKGVIVRLDDVTKEWLEDIGTASGYPTLQDFMEAVVRGLIDGADVEVLETVKRLRAARANKIIPKAQSPAARARKRKAA